MTFKINGGERVGVVGRTGAGKSTLMLAMFRLAEASSGSIHIDNVDISTISLKKLRSNLAIIPQDPVLWSTTIRDNLDPFNTVNDEQIWKSLEDVGLKDLLINEKMYPGGLNFLVSEGGSNFSVGQRQLFCIARALLRKSKILMLDEATASIDRDTGKPASPTGLAPDMYQLFFCIYIARSLIEMFLFSPFITDRLIQSMIRESFQGVTTMVIAHRLNTIMDFDRILVFDDGKVCEFDTPLNLLNKPQNLKDSIFRSMVEATGKESAQLLRSIAEGKTGILDVEDIVQVEEDEQQQQQQQPQNEEKLEEKE